MNSNAHASADIRSLPLGPSDSERRTADAEKRRRYAAELDAQQFAQQFQHQQRNGPQSYAAPASSRRGEDDSIPSIPLGPSAIERKLAEAEKRRAYAQDLQAQMQQQQMHTNIRQVLHAELTRLHRP